MRKTDFHLASLPRSLAKRAAGAFPAAFPIHDPNARKELNMTLTLWKKRDPSFGNGGMSQLRDEMDRTINRFFSDPWSGMGMIEPKSIAANGARNRRQRNRQRSHRSRIPGIPAKDLEISISGTTLTISGQKEGEGREKGGELLSLRVPLRLFPPCG